MYVCVGVCGQETQEGSYVHVQEVDGEAEKAQDDLRSHTAWNEEEEDDDKRRSHYCSSSNSRPCSYR